MIHGPIDSVLRLLYRHGPKLDRSTVAEFILDCFHDAIDRNNAELINYKPQKVLNVKE